jgi:hypothetical protein
MKLALSPVSTTRQKLSLFAVGMTWPRCRVLLPRRSSTFGQRSKLAERRGDKLYPLDHELALPGGRQSRPMPSTGVRMTVLALMGRVDDDLPRCGIADKEGSGK